MQQAFCFRNICYFSLTGIAILDILLTLFHLLLVGFNLLGWIWKRTRKLHFIVIMITAGCWFVLGIWYGIGYCPVTDWQWHVKELLGERNMHNSFIKYFADRITGTDVNGQFIDILIAACFFLALFASRYCNFLMKKAKRT